MTATHPRHPFLTSLVLCVLACLLLPQGAEAAVRAWLDRNTITFGESVTLNVEGAEETPDFSVLESDFRIAGRSNNSQIQIINGAMARTQLWAVALEPKREGTLQIPALKAGNEQTAPLTLRVEPVQQGAADRGDEVFLEVEVDTTQPYVQQSVAYTVRLFYALPLLEGNLDEPGGDGLQVRRVGQDVTYTRQIDARRYSVVERHYVLTPTRSGETTVQGVLFRGRVSQGARYNSFFNQGVPVTVGSETLHLNVRPAPAGAPSPWLPAQRLQLRDDASALPQSANVGEALSLTLSVDATGLAAEQLPELTLPAIDGAEVYPDQETRETRDDGQQIIGKRSRKFAIVPLREGRLTLPERHVSWWNLETDKAQRTTLPARSIDVAAIAGTPSSSSLPPAITAENAPTPEQVPTSGSNTAWFWQALSAFLAAAWLFTLLAWRRSRAGVLTATPAPPSDEEISRLTWRPALAHALEQNDLRAVAKALLRLRPGLRDLTALSEQLTDPAQQAAVAHLDKVLYRGDAPEGLLEQIRTAFSRSPQFHTPPPATASPLPPLYPGELAPDATRKSP